MGIPSPYFGSVGALMPVVGVMSASGDSTKPEVGAPATFRCLLKRDEALRPILLELKDWDRPERIVQLILDQPGEEHPNTDRPALHRDHPKGR